MTVDFVSLAAIVFVAACTPILARLVPGRAIPETVFLLIAGALLGPNMLGLIQIDETVSFLSDLGLSFLFLLAGYEIDTLNLTGSQGKRGLATWAVTLVLAFLLVHLILTATSAGNPTAGIAIAIALTTTALGTLIPILKERGLTGTRIGDSILSYGTWGELGPVIAIALLLSTRKAWVTVVILIAFVAIAVLTARFSSRVRNAGGKFIGFLAEGSQTTSQAFVRVTVLLLVALVALSAIFNLDIVLGSFAAGFVLRYIIPEGNKTLEMKLDGIGYGFFIPLFFVVSGAGIDLLAVGARPGLLVGFIIMLLLVRAVPIYVAISTGKDTRDMTPSSHVSVALYCTTALPLIVAVTSVAVGVGAMDSQLASVLVSAGAVTVFLMPLLASLAQWVVDVKPVEALREMAAHPGDARAIIADHRALQLMLLHDAGQVEDTRHAEDDHGRDSREADTAGAAGIADEQVFAKRAAAAHAAHAAEVARAFAAERRRRIAEHRRKNHDSTS